MLKKIFKHVLPRLPKNIVFPSAYVINTDKSSEPGEHWLAIFYDSDGFCTFFDSFARSPSVFSLDEFLNKTANGWRSNNMQLQDMNTATCGYYCVYFVLLMSRGLCLEDILLLFDEKNLFYNDFRISRLFTK
jgi:hypothetical protein